MWCSKWWKRSAEAGQPLLKVGVVNQQMPFMPNGAEVAPGFFDMVVTDPACTHTLFAPPNNKVSAADYAIGLHASSLVADGGTLQIGIGSLGDAIGQALIVRDRHGDEYRASCKACAPTAWPAARLGRFDRGLYGCSEMFVNGFLKLIEAGIIRREVLADAVLQQLLNRAASATRHVTRRRCSALLEAGTHAVPRWRRGPGCFLQHLRGVLRAPVQRAPAPWCAAPTAAAADLSDPAGRHAGQHLLGTRLRTASS
jgi:acyl-CoA hydrolase